MKPLPAETTQLVTYTREKCECGCDQVEVQVVETGTVWFWCSQVWEKYVALYGSNEMRKIDS